MRFIGQKHPFTKCVAIDVDDTLVINERLNTAVVDYAKERQAAGFEILLWSAKGREHAERIADKFGIRNLFSAIISKPGYIVDDMAWSWTRYTRVVKIDSLSKESVDV